MCIFSSPAHPQKECMMFPQEFPSYKMIYFTKRATKGRTLDKVRGAFPAQLLMIAWWKKKIVCFEAANQAGCWHVLL